MGARTISQGGVTEEKVWFSLVVVSVSGPMGADPHFYPSASEIRIQYRHMGCGGLKPAYFYVKSALESGRHVVTSNKELVAQKGAELLALAQKNNLNFLFEASVGGGIPIIRPISQCLAANELTEVCGILNGTTNYILTRMIRAGLSFDAALREAQANGYAEADPTADVEGHDACRKICILAAIAFGRHIYPRQVPTEGITGVTLADVAYAESCNKKIKLLGRAIRQDDGRICAYVAPHLLDGENPLSGVEDVFNAVLVKGDMLGDVVFYGKGAGKLPTASAVVADVVDALKNGVKVHDSLFWQPAEPVEGMLTDPAPAAYYVRVEGIAPAVAEAIYGKGHVVEEHFDGCSYFVDSADDKALAEAARKVEAMGGSVKLVLRRLPEDA